MKRFIFKFAGDQPKAVIEDTELGIAQTLTVNEAKQLSAGLASFINVREAYVGIVGDWDDIDTKDLGPKKTTCPNCSWEGPLAEASEIEQIPSCPECFTPIPCPEK